jgi:hypothetical protein
MTISIDTEMHLSKNESPSMMKTLSTLDIERMNYSTRKAVNNKHRTNFNLNTQKVKREIKMAEN